MSSFLEKKNENTFSDTLTLFDMKGVLFLKLSLENNDLNTE